MIAFGCAIGEAEPYLRFAEPGIELAREPDSEVLAFAAVDTIARSNNILLDAAARMADLEAFVLLSPFARITDPGFTAKIRDALADPAVAVAGCLGARGVRSIAWWEGTEVSCAHGFRYGYHEHGEGEFEGLPWVETTPAPAEVDALDGSVLVLSPWAVRELRFDETLVLGHGFDVDYCLQARAAGRKVVTVDFAVTQRRSLKIVSDLELWTEAHADFARKWSGRIPGMPADEDVQARARRVEAEREAVRSVAYFKRLSYDARVEALEREREAAEQTLSWRITRPLRELNKWRAERAGGDARSGDSAVTHGWGRESRL
jgi:hypothetical protein